MSAMIPPMEWRGKRLSIIDVLTFVRDQVRAGFAMEMFLGTVDVHAMVAFVEGVRFSNYASGLADAEFQGFLRWLRDERREWPAGGWWTLYLSELKGDHQAAIMRFLDRVAEFRHSGTFTAQPLRPWDA
jgi:hypothetical protein